MTEHLEQKEEEHEYNSILAKVEVYIKEEKEKVFVEDGPSSFEPNSYSMKIKQEINDESEPNSPETEQRPNITRIDIKEEESSEHDNADSDEDYCFSKDIGRSKERRKTAFKPKLRNEIMCCPSCEYTSSKLDNFKKHLLIHSSNKQLHCEKCDYKCHWKSWMDRHERKHESKHETPFSCNSCDYQTRWKSCIERHTLKHAMLKPYSCASCTYSATTKGDLRMHTMTHSDTKRHKCQCCSYSTPRRKSLVIHIKNNHTKEGSSGRRNSSRRCRINESDIRIMTATGFRCPHCQYTCGTKNNIKRHIGHHFNKPEYPCDHCSYKSHRKDYLKSHMLTHSKIKAFECLQCSFTCSWNSALRRHMLTHLDERPFQCNDCEFKSSDKSNLKRHVKSHLEIRLLLCSGCDVFFPAVENLVVHKKISHRRDITGFLS